MNWPRLPRSTFECIELDINLQLFTAVGVVHGEVELFLLSSFELVDGEPVKRQVFEFVHVLFLCTALQHVVVLFDIPGAEDQFSGLLKRVYLYAEVVSAL